MNNLQLWFTLHSKEILHYSIFLTFIFSLFIGVSFFKRSRHRSINQFDSECFGIINSTTLHKRIDNSETGSKVFPDFYQIEYSYTVNDQNFNKDERIYFSQLSIHQKDIITHQQKGDTIAIAFNKKKPSISLINIKK